MKELHHDDGAFSVGNDVAEALKRLTVALAGSRMSAIITLKQQDGSTVEFTLGMDRSSGRRHALEKFPSMRPAKAATSAGEKESAWVTSCMADQPRRCRDRGSHPRWPQDRDAGQTASRRELRVLVRARRRRRQRPIDDLRLPTPPFLSQFNFFGSRQPAIDPRVAEERSSWLPTATRRLRLLPKAIPDRRRSGAGAGAGRLKLIGAGSCRFSPHPPATPSLPTN